MLLTHGFTGSSRDWAKLVAPLAESHTVITWDLRGHGKSAAPDDPAQYSVELAVADMAALLDRAGAERAVLVGHSLGGFLSLAFHLAHRERVRALALVDTGPGYRKDEARAGWNRMVEKRAVELEKKGAPGLAHAARGILAQRDGRAIESLATIAVPALVVVGEHDEPFLAGSKHMAEKVPGARLALVPGAGHSPQDSHPQEVLAQLLELLARA